MKQKRFTIIICLLIFVVACFTTIIVIKSYNNDNDESQVALSQQFSGKVNQWEQEVGTVKRNIPTTCSNEGLNERYPTYGTSLADITDTEKDNILSENSLIMASSSTYDAIDKDGNLLLNGEKTGKKLYKHTSSQGMYYGDALDTEKALVKQITITANEQRNYVTGLYAPAGEVVKIEISQSDLDKIGGKFLVCVGQVSHRNNINNIWKARNDFSRMPVIANQLTISSTTGYVGNVLGGPIYIYPNTFGETFTVKISGAVGYAHYVHGQTTQDEWEEMKNYSAPYYDFEVWDLGVRLSGPKKYASFDYDNLVKVGNLWEKIVRTSRQVPCSANATISVGYVYDCFVAAGSACAFQGGHSWINAPCSWLAEATNYDSMVSNGFWGNIHEFNHLYQSYGMENSKTNEVTNNATSLLSYVLYTKISSKRSLNDNTLTGWNRYTDPSRSLRETLSAYANNQTQSALNCYADLIHTFGVDIFTKATRLQNGFGVDAWYEALSHATDYNFTYYFEKILGQTISADKKALYDTQDKITFVPVATIFQTGRDFYENGKQVFTQTVMPYQIERGESCEIDFNNYLILPSDFTFKIKSITSPKNGTIIKTGENIYKFTPNKEDLSGTIEVTVQLQSDSYTTKDVTLLLAFNQYDKNQVEFKKYTYSTDFYYSTVDEAVANNFEGYTSIEEGKSTSTFINHLSTRQIGVVEGKIYINKSSKYAFCLRSGRGNNTLYLSVNNKENLEQVLSLNTDHGGFSLSGEHVVELELNEGDYVYFKEITLSRHYADAFTELGMANLDEQNPTMKTIPTAYLCTNDMTMPNNEFTSNEKYPREYTTKLTLETSDSSNHKYVSSNMSSWDNSTGIENIFDENKSTFFHNNRNNFVSESNPFVLVADIQKVGKFNNIKIASRTSGQYNLPSTFELYGSIDGENWELAGTFNNLSLSGNTVQSTFDDATFRFYKLIVTDTKSQNGGNKYVTIESIELSYVLNGVEKSPFVLSYYKTSKTNFTKIRQTSSFGELIKGNGKVSYEFTGTGIAILTRQDNDYKIKLTIDNEVHEITLLKSNSKQIAFSITNLKNTKHDIKIEVLSGQICMDSIIEKYN